MVSRQRSVHMEDLTVGQVIAIHDRIVADQVADPRILSEGSLFQLVFQANLIPEVVPKAAFIFYYLCAFPAFRDGNRETALAAAQDALASCGGVIPGDLSGLMALADGIHAYTTEPEDVEAWFALNVRKNGNAVDR
jgi:hypothetical protein